MSLNPDPNKQATELLFSCKKKPIIHPVLTFNNSPVVKVKDHKHLGLILQPNLSFEKHLNEKIIKAKKMIALIRNLNRFLPLKTLNLMYKALVRSHLDYCDIIYHIPATIHQNPLGTSLNYSMENIEKIQYQAALAVTGTWQGSNRSKLYDELGWETLSDRRMCRRVLQLHKIINNKTPTFLKEKLPPRRRALIHLPNVFQTYRCRTTKFRNSFFPDATVLWNNIISAFDEFPTFEVLKKHILSLIRPEPRSIFSIHSPRMTKIIFQLRIGLSPLKHHKSEHNFLDTPSDICSCLSGIEDTKHFFLICPIFTVQRQALEENVEGILRIKNLPFVKSTELYLYGHPLLNANVNKLILTETVSFIQATKRFDN